MQLWPIGIPVAYALILYTNRSAIVSMGTQLVVKARKAAAARFAAANGVEGGDALAESSVSVVLKEEAPGHLTRSASSAVDAFGDPTVAGLSSLASRESLAKATAFLWEDLRPGTLRTGAS